MQGRSLGRCHDSCKGADVVHPAAPPPCLDSGAARLINAAPPPPLLLPLLPSPSPPLPTSGQRDSRIIKVTPARSHLQVLDAASPDGGGGGEHAAAET